MRPHMNPGKVYRTSKLEEKSWKIIGFFLENAPIRKKNRQNLKMILIDRHSEQQLKDKVI